ncbi:MAG: VWA domain-containing protein [Rikenellaceae bacterium]
MHFASPHFLWLLLLLIPMVAYYIYRTMQGGATITVSTTATLRGVPRTMRYYLRHLPFVLRMFAFALLTLSLARPQDIEEHQNISTEGIDIVMAIDISGSMLARDFQPDRITAAKEVANTFIKERVGDRIGLVVFAGEAFTQSPLTTDKATLQTLLSRIRSGVIEDGTAIGNGLATALNRLRESDSKSKVIILLTDGVNNRGEIAPLTAATIAQEMGVKVYTIGVGSMGTAPYPRVDMYGNIVDYVQMPVEIDEDTLTQIAQGTGGEYYRATNMEKLEAIYDQINKLERSTVEITDYTTYHEKFLYWLLMAIGVLLLETLLSSLFLKRLP